MRNSAIREQNLDKWNGLDIFHWKLPSHPNFTKFHFYLKMASQQEKQDIWLIWEISFPQLKTRIPATGQWPLRNEKTKGTQPFRAFRISVWLGFQSLRGTQAPSCLNNTATGCFSPVWSLPSPA
jgi:hypothetical protein